MTINLEFLMKEKIYSNAIFSLDECCIGEKVLLIYGSEDNRFITNRAYDLIFFLSKVIEQKLKKCSENQLENSIKQWVDGLNMKEG